MKPKTLSRRPIAAATLLAVPAALASPPAPATLCSAGETTFFACRLARSTKLAALCGHAGAPRPWLQYRIGVPGHAPELLVPKTVDDPDMASTFFADGPSATRDHSYWQVGVWFQNVDATYELQTSQEHDYQDGGDTASAILVWRSALPSGAPKELDCARASPSQDLLAARDVIEAMSPRWHHWGLSPWDWQAAKRDQERSERRAAEAEEAASAQKARTAR